MCIYNNLRNIKTVSWTVIKHSSLWLHKTHLQVRGHWMRCDHNVVFLHFCKLMWVHVTAVVFKVKLKITLLVHFACYSQRIHSKEFVLIRLNESDLYPSLNIYIKHNLKVGRVSLGNFLNFGSGNESLAKFRTNS